MPGHPVVHIELSAKDLKKAGEFYSSVFGWTVVQTPELNYATFDATGGPGGGFNPANDENPAGTVVVYIGTDDIDDSLAKIEKEGGKTVVPKTVIPGFGWFAMFKDPTGNTVGLYTVMPQGQA